MLGKIKKNILDTLFPISCAFCQKPEEWICQECLDKIEILTEQVCPYCEKIPSSQGKICSHCQEIFWTKNKPASLDGLIVTSRYEKMGLARLIHFYKYNFVQDLSWPLGKLLLKAFWKNNSPLPDQIVPIPLHRRRLRWRGFNQAELLAKYLSENLSPGFIIPLAGDIVERKKYTTAQMKIKNYQERQKNLQGAFVLNYEVETQNFASQNFASLQDKTILLVDDICTTGSTLFECAQVLKQAGAQKVWGIVLARQEMK